MVQAKRRIVHDLHERYVRGSEKKAIVQTVLAFVCHLGAPVVRGIGCPCTKLYVSTRVIKHIYDKRPAEEFDFLVNNVAYVAKYPDAVYKNRDAKRGGYCFVKEMGGCHYLCSVEVVEEDGIEKRCEIVTFFRISDGYLKNYELLWEWKVGGPSS